MSMTQAQFFFLRGYPPELNLGRHSKTPAPQGGLLVEPEILVGWLELSIKNGSES